MKFTPRPLRLFWLWRTAGRFLIAAALVIALLPAPKVIGSVAFGDKIGHLVAFAALMLWYAQLYVGRDRWHCALALVGFGILIELLQALVPYRSADGWDLLADVVGVGVGLLLAYSRLGDALAAGEAGVLAWWAK